VSDADGAQVWATKVDLRWEQIVTVGVKNGFSDPTKEKRSRSARKDVMNDHQGKALREGCHEREWAQISVSSREKNNTKGT